MQKLSFLLGKWTGECFLLQGPGQSLDLHQTEEVQYKLDGLLLVIEGVGRSKSDNQLALQAFGIISFDDESATYRMRAFNEAASSKAKSNSSTSPTPSPGVSPSAPSNRTPSSASTTGANGPNLPNSSSAPTHPKNSSNNRPPRGVVSRVLSRPNSKSFSPIQHFRQPSTSAKVFHRYTPAFTFRMYALKATKENPDE